LANQPSAVADERITRSGTPGNNEASVAKKSTRPSTSNGKTILVVEDENSVRETVSLNLRYLGYNVLEAENGEQGLAISRDYNQELDMVFTDVVMPRLSGPAMISLMRKEKITAPVLYTTGYADAPELDNLDHVIIKPYTTKSLASRIREILDPAEV
jgi:CheY-like chemotaxis protein|tara:strand:+ start:142 stop:612 length:471 start_codon:yes stop_codon:yes gene_type:complete